MKKKRYLPFGYQMNEGNIIPDILESSAVQSIFENYRNGASLQTLAKQMQQSGLKYRENAVWNKAMIARILDCEKYISEEFPEHGGQPHNVPLLPRLLPEYGKRIPEDPLPDKYPAQQFFWIIRLLHPDGQRLLPEPGLSGHPPGHIQPEQM